MTSKRALDGESLEDLPASKRARSTWNPVEAVFENQSLVRLIASHLRAENLLQFTMVKKGWSLSILDHDMVIRSVYPNETLKGKLKPVVELLKGKAIFVPSPIRMLRLVNATKCERCVRRRRPSMKVYGLSSFPVSVIHFSILCSFQFLSPSGFLGCQCLLICVRRFRRGVLHAVSGQRYAGTTLAQTRSSESSSKSPSNGKHFPPSQPSGNFQRSCSGFERVFDRTNVHGSGLDGSFQQTCHTRNHSRVHQPCTAAV